MSANIGPEYVCDDCGVYMTGREAATAVGRHGLCRECLIYSHEAEVDAPDNLPEDETALPAIPEYPIEALPKAGQELVVECASAGLPAGIAGGAALAALASAIGGNAETNLLNEQRPILWIPLFAPTGAGKSPVLEMAFKPIREWGEESRPILFGDMTLEALARELNAAEGSVGLLYDELPHLLQGLGEYKRGGGSDRRRLLALWTGQPWTMHRVGSGTTENKTRIAVYRPTVPICGGIQPHLHALFGEAEDGFAARWLPHLAAKSDITDTIAEPPQSWSVLLEVLLGVRGSRRAWSASVAAERAFKKHRKRWHERSRSRSTSALESSALIKADTHCARIALVLAEAELVQTPGNAGTIRPSHIESAAQIVDYSLGCWSAMPTSGGLGLTRRDQVLSQGCDRLHAWLEQRGGKASRREIQRAHAGGVRTVAEVDALLAEWEARHPGTRSEQHGVGGLATVIVSLPPRRVCSTVSPCGDTAVPTSENPYKQGVLDDCQAVSPQGDSPRGDSARGDGPNAEELATPEQEALLERHQEGEQ